MKNKSYVYILTISFCLSLSGCSSCGATKESDSVVESVADISVEEFEVAEVDTTTALSDAENQEITEKNDNADRGEAHKTEEEEEIITEEEKEVGKIESLDTIKVEEVTEDDSWITEDMLNELSTHPFFEGCTLEQIHDALMDPAGTAKVSQSKVDKKGGPAQYWNSWPGADKKGIKARFDDLVADTGKYYLPEVEARKKAEAEAVQSKPQQNNQSSQSTEKVDIGINDNWQGDNGPGETLEPDETPEGGYQRTDIATSHDWR